MYDQGHIHHQLQAYASAWTLVMDTNKHCVNRLNIYDTIHMYSGITSGRVLYGELLYPKILEVDLFAFAYRLFLEDFSSIDGALKRNLHETVCRQMQTN